MSEGIYRDRYAMRSAGRQQTEDAAETLESQKVSLREGVPRPVWMRGLVVSLLIFLVACQTSPPTIEESSIVRHSELLRQKLLGMRERDQAVRAGFSSTMSEETMAAIMAVDQEHLGRLQEIIRHYGWPGRSLVSVDGSEAAWLLVQHTTLPFMNRCLPLLQEAVGAGEAEPRHYAYLYDRVQVQEGNLQKFGTQYKFSSEGVLEREPLANPDSVDQRRAALGLPTMKEYEAVLRATYQ